MSNYEELLREIKNSEEKILEVLDGILETIDVLNNTEDMNSIKKSLQDIKAAKIFLLKTSEKSAREKINSPYVLKCTATFKEKLLATVDDVKREILAALETLKTNPYSSRHLHGNLKGFYRLRFNNKAVIYTVKEGNKTIIALTITTMKHALST